jgi:hypothetical protein
MLRCDGRVTYMRAAGTSLVVDLSKRVPTVLHWGRISVSCPRQALPRWP